MLIKCLKCGYDNQLGAIFCRSCGDKLNIEAIKLPTKRTNTTGCFPAVRKLLMIAIFLGIIGVVAGIFVPYGLIQYDKPDSETAEFAKAKINEMLDSAKMGRGAIEFAFTPEEASFGFVDTFINTDSMEFSTYSIKDVNFDIDDGGAVHIALDTKLGGKIPVRFELIGNIVNPEGKEDGDTAQIINFDIVQAKMGHLPIPAILQDKIVQKFYPLLNGDQDFKDFINSIASIRVDGDSNFIVTLKEEESY